MNKYKNKTLFLIFHGHFYQPPREDPWTGEVEVQPSAAPLHDWNERIYQECYKPNTRAVITDKNDKILKFVNNFEYLSFNIGPTLLSWIKKKHPHRLQMMIDADKKSVEKHNGHGNAIAQIYNHVIMPLANENDKITQIKWGIEDFKFHFGRDPEGMWLPETACNEATLEALIQEGVKFTILDPSQAEKIRKLPGGSWTDVTGGGLDTTRPYRFFSKIHSGASLTVFFYDGLLSKNIAFDDYITNAERMMERIEIINLDNSHMDELISAAVDGETFGHHKPFTERTIAYLLSELAPKHKYKVTNFGEFLSNHTPLCEVEIKKGRNGEGTSWSCAHGVGRWQEDCGCGQGEPGWNQKWRRPLRDSLNWLRDEMIKITEIEGGKYLKNVWDARNDYIHVVLDPSRESYEKFFYFNAKQFLTEDESELCIKIMEMQRNAMYMFTSCGWFFSDVSGLETLIILRFAARAIELAREVSGIDFEEEFLARLSEARSNLPQYRDGRYIYESKIKLRNKYMSA